MKTLFYIWLVGWIISAYHVYYHIHRETIDGEAAMLSMFLGMPSWAYIIMIIYYDHKG